MKIDIYTTPGCMYCAKAKAALECLRLEFNLKTVEGAEKKHVMDKLQEKFGFDDSKRTFPKIFVDGRIILGYDDLKKEILLGNFKVD